MGIINAVGNTLLPVYIFPRVRLKDSFLKGASPGSVGFCNKSGWMIAHLFLDVLKHMKNIFIQNRKLVNRFYLSWIIIKYIYSASP